MAQKTKQPEPERQLQANIGSSPIVTFNKPTSKHGEIILLGLILLSIVIMLTNLQQIDAKLNNRLNLIEKNFESSTQSINSKLESTQPTGNSPFCYVDMPNGARVFTIDGREIKTQCDINKTVVQP